MNKKKLVCSAIKNVQTDIPNSASIAIKNAPTAGMTKDSSADWVNMVEEPGMLGKRVTASQRKRCLRDVRKIMEIAKWMDWSHILNADQGMIMLDAVSAGPTLLTARNREWIQVSISLVPKRLLYVPLKQPSADQIKTTMQGYAMINAHPTWKELVQFAGEKIHKAGSNAVWEQQKLHKIVER